MKYLLVLLVVVIAVGIWRSQRRAAAAERVKSRPSAKQRPLAAPEEMAECAVCGLHLPRADAIQSQGRYFCCAEHLKAGRQP